MLELIGIAALISIFAVVYSEVLTRPYMILNWLYVYLDEKIGNCACRAKLWLFNPIIGCSKCVSGQGALWSYFYFMVNYNILHHISFITITIFFTLIISKLNERINKG